MEDTSQSYGYCHITLEPYDARKLLRSNTERAFVISQLQDLLSPRLVLGDIPIYRQLASCIDLLAFSISDTAIHLLVFSIDTTIATDFAHRISARLTQFQYEFRPFSPKQSREVRVSLEQLTGPHQALEHSIQIHLLHKDWEYDRYSSIGFFLHDRRGDWMRLWRLASLYENSPQLYCELIEQNLQRPPFMTALGFPASSLRA